MNNKEYIAELARRMSFTVKDTQRLMGSLVEEMTTQLDDGNSIAVQGFGTFDVKKKLERVVKNPTTGQRMLVPPKLVVNFKPAASFKDRIQTTEEIR